MSDAHGDDHAYDVSANVFTGASVLGVEKDIN